MLEPHLLMLKYVQRKFHCKAKAAGSVCVCARARGGCAFLVITYNSNVFVKSPPNNTYLLIFKQGN